MVNINSIKNIEGAKNAKYNGKALTSEEKSIFDNKLLTKKIGDKPDLDKLHEAAQLLDNVKEAEKIQARDGLARVIQLLNTMKKAKDSNSISYQVVNDHHQQVDKAINGLESLSKTENIQGIVGSNVETEESISISGLTITAEADANNTQGVKAEGDVKLKKGFTLTNATITSGTSGGKSIRTEKEIELEITRKEKSLERKNKMLDSHTEKGNDEVAQRVEKEIEKLEEEIDKLRLELEQQQAQIQIN